MKLPKGLSKDTYILAFASLFSDISTEMLYPVLPIFITSVLKDSPAIVGVIEGAATAVQYIIQGFSGWLADKFKAKKYIALFGYTLTALAKPFIGLSVNWPQVLLGRFTDRLGAGIRSAPRDALIAGSADENARGRAFGLEGIGDNAGAFVGPLVAIVLLFFFKVNIRSIFYLAFIPGIAALLLITLVKEKKAAHIQKTQLHFSLAAFPRSYWIYLGITALFGLGNSSNAFLILQARSLGIPLIITICIYAGFNLAAAAISYPAGSLSDKLGRKYLLLAGFAIFAITYLGFALSHSVILIGALFVFYGIYSGLYRAVGKAFATDNIAQELRASAIGIYSTVVGITSLLANIIGGQLWTRVSPSATFLWGVGFALVAILASSFFTTSRIESS
ncbi:MAG TPA: MFS transporter [Patescibacteria group bacterium]|nr:MFS transporter [Patescibacteria group bacterium]